MAKLQLQNISKMYPGGSQAVKDISFTVKDKEFVVLVGPSGCGKSTTLRMIAGLEDITDGTLLIDGKKVNDLTPGERELSMVFQNYALYPHMTAYQNMAFGLKISKVPKLEIKQRVAQAADILNIQDLLQKKPAKMSGGQRQRVAIGRAIVRRPQLFLFDEPLSNLDAELRTKMRIEIAKLHQTLGVTIVYVTHDQVEAMTLGDRIVVLKDGEIMQIDAPMELYANPKNKFVAGFIGSPPMNFLPGKLINSGGRLLFQHQDWTVDLSPLGLQTGQKFINQSVFLGIRAENIHARNNESIEMLKIPVEVSGIELLGSEQLVYAQHNKHQLIARFPTDSLVTNHSIVDFYLDLSHSYLFDAVKEERIY